MLQSHLGGYPAIEYLRQSALSIGRNLPECRAWSACNHPLCPACNGRKSRLLGKQLYQSAVKLPESRLKFLTLTSRNVELPALRQASQEVMSATRKTLKILGIAHSAVRSEFSVDEWVRSYHPHSHSLISTPPNGKNYVKTADWQDAWLSELPQWLHPIEGGSHIKAIDNLERACGYIAGNPYKKATPETVGEIMAGIAALKGLQRFSTSGYFRTKD
ncbi:MAG TPA: protein rep [Edaphobacter sp.]|nr:protein rep [Edaphobacter sp.]